MVCCADSDEKDLRGIVVASFLLEEIAMELKRTYHTQCNSPKGIPPAPLARSDGLSDRLVARSSMVISKIVQIM